MITEFFLSNLVFAMLFSLYMAAFRKLTFFAVNRYYLLIIVLISALTPWLSMGVDQVRAVGLATVSLPEILVSNQTESGAFSLNEWVGLGYWIGVALGMLWFGRSMVSIFKILTHSKRPNDQDYLVSEGAHAFSFFSSIHISEYIDADTRKMILSHEQVHRLQWHSVDVMIYALLRVFCWWNPFVHLAFKEVQLNHEYLSDKASQKLFGTDYQYALLNQTLGTKLFPLTNAFHSKSMIKNRIKMMNKKRPNMRSLLTYSLTLPVLCGGLWLNACNQATPLENEKTASLEEVMKPATDNKTVYDKVDVMPQFPGGNEGLLQFFKDGFNYPKDLQEAGVGGRVVVAFVVNEDGSTTDFAGVEADDERLIAPAIKFLKGMPSWDPGMNEGKAVKVKMMLPVQYTLN